MRCHGFSCCWCLAHRVELSAFNSTFFSDIDELLLHMYYMYKKSPKKCHELEDIVIELKNLLHACGTRFVAHKVSSLERMINRFGAYFTHLTAIVEDSRMKSTDRQKAKGYILKWQNSKILLGHYNLISCFWSGIFPQLIRAGGVSALQQLVLYLYKQSHNHMM